MYASMKENYQKSSVVIWLNAYWLNFVRPEREIFGSQLVCMTLLHSDRMSWPQAKYFTVWLSHSVDKFTGIIIYSLKNKNIFSSRDWPEPV